jgi:hypothetical protein
MSTGTWRHFFSCRVGQDRQPPPLATATMDEKARAMMLVVGKCIWVLSLLVMMC